MKRLKDLLSRDEVSEEYMVNWDEEIKGISDHSQSVKEGYIFVARRGTKLNGKEFIPEALKRGAKLIIQEDSIDLDLYAPQLKLKDFKETLGKLLSRFYDHPQNSLTLVGITGTNGKTSSTFFIRALSSALGVKSGYIGSIYYDVGEVLPSRETTPSSFVLFPFLKKARDLGIKLLALEVSSHALDQDRIFGLNFSACGWTNLSRDHLDYHGDMESYFQAKKK
ncbi:MAG: Mur ligase family protein, partial [Thermodesulfobacteriaceae bacterium]